jgi:hypothetical protein
MLMLGSRDSGSISDSKSDLEEEVADVTGEAGDDLPF